jgi:hypothetical protein
MNAACRANAGASAASRHLRQPLLQVGDVVVDEMQALTFAAMFVARPEGSTETLSSELRKHGLRVAHALGMVLHCSSIY